MHYVVRDDTKRKVIIKHGQTKCYARVSGAQREKGGERERDTTTNTGKYTSSSKFLF